MSGYGKRFADWYQGNNEKEKETPKSGIRRVLYLSWNYTGGLLLSTLLFLICCIPVITIPAAICAQNAYLGKMYRQGYGFDRSDYWKEFRAGLWKHLPAGIVFAAMEFYGYYLMSLAGNFAGSGTSGMLTGVGAGVCILAWIIGGWYFMQASMLELSEKQLFHNAMILAVAEWKKSGMFLAESLLFLAFMLGLAPVSLLFLIPALGLYQLSLCGTLGNGVLGRIVVPFKNKEKENAGCQR